MRAFKRAVRRQPELRARLERALRQLSEDSFHPALHSHKLKGTLSGAWACTVDYDNRILFEFVRNPESGAERGESLMYCRSRTADHRPRR